MSRSALELFQEISSILNYLDSLFNEPSIINDGSWQSFQNTKERILQLSQRCLKIFSLQRTQNRCAVCFFAVFMFHEDRHVLQVWI